jgi:hypothetical protein
VITIVWNAHPGGSNHDSNIALGHKCGTQQTLASVRIPTYCTRHAAEKMQVGGIGLPREIVNE